MKKKASDSVNNLKIFNNEDFGDVRTTEINGRTEYVVNGTMIDRFKLLAIACDENNEDNAWEIMRVASIIFHPQDDDVFNSLYGAAAMEITRKFKNDEMYFQNIFKENYSKIRKGKIIKNKTDGHNIPDAWVEEDGYIIPVEVKLRKFDQQALNQLLRYIKAYGSSRGIAVARELAVELPHNIEFISFSEWEVLEEE